jgi:hypothetical protein
LRGSEILAAALLSRRAIGGCRDHQVVMSKKIGIFKRQPNNAHEEIANAQMWLR